MNLQFYLEKLFASEEFQKFKKENPEAYLCSGFISINKESKEESNKVHLDYFIEKDKKMFSFQLDSLNIEAIPVELVPENAPCKISDNIDFDFKEIEDMITARMEKEKVKKKIQKILLSLQKIDNKEYLIGTVFITGMGMIKINIDLDEKKILEFKEKSFLDMINIFKRK